MELRLLHIATRQQQTENNANERRFEQKEKAAKPRQQSQQE
jgi:hypothetical protein